MEDRIDVPIKDWKSLKTRVLILTISNVALFVTTIVGFACTSSLQGEKVARTSFITTHYTFEEKACARIMAEALRQDMNNPFDSLHYANLVLDIKAFSPEVQKKAQEILGYESRR